MLQRAAVGTPQWPAAKPRVKHFTLHALFSELSAELLTSSVELAQAVLTLQAMPSAGLVYVFDIFHDFLPLRWRKRIRYPMAYFWNR